MTPTDKEDNKGKYLAQSSETLNRNFLTLGGSAEKPSQETCEHVGLEVTDECWSRVAAF